VNPYFTTPQPVRRIQSVMALAYDIGVATVAATMAGNEFAMAAFIRLHCIRVALLVIAAILLLTGLLPSRQPELTTAASPCSSYPATAP
jgi:hypothetical protein